MTITGLVEFRGWVFLMTPPGIAFFLHPLYTFINIKGKWPDSGWPDHGLFVVTSFKTNLH